MEDGYELVVEPCYLGTLTHSVCPKADNKVLGKI